MKQRVVLVTGASSGIGKAAAKLFAEKGYITYATARRPEAFSDLQALNCQTLFVDVTDEQSMRDAVDHIEAKHGAIDILVNNAGYSQGGPLEEISIAAMRQQFETNVFGPLRMSQLVLTGMRRQSWGRIINVSSSGGEYTIPGLGAYTMSKHALESLTDTLRYEVQSFGIDVISILPGGVATNFISTQENTLREHRANSPYDVFRENVIKNIQSAAKEDSPYGIMTPDHIAQVILQAASSPRPQTRYRVGLLAKILPHIRHLLPDRLWDRVMKTQIPMS